ncbi:hypothetical protein HYU95_00805 [Candidatus Daviesbacteria bacterium]|nr:hypothetical protein [Candidatus Daviesbacteria bacterium]
MKEIIVVEFIQTTRHKIITISLGVNTNPPPRWKRNFLIPGRYGRGAQMKYLNLLLI